MAARIVDTAELREPRGSQEEEVRPPVYCGVLRFKVSISGSTKPRGVMPLPVIKYRAASIELLKG